MDAAPGDAGAAAAPSPPQAVGACAPAVAAPGGEGAARAADAAAANSRATADASRSCPTHPRVASSAPIRLHVLFRDEATGDVPPCDCGRQHATFGDTYTYCACGLSAAQPWCDGACTRDARAAAFPPRPFVVDKRQTFLLMCACKRTRDPRGFCDGEHIHIDWGALEW